jgi:hypothetical protein
MQSTLVQAEEPEPEPKERTMTVLNLTAGLGLTADVTEMSECTDFIEQQAAVNRQGIMRVLACYKEILNYKKRSLCTQSSELDFFKSSSGTHASPPVLLDTGGDHPDDLPAVQVQVPLPF